MEKTKIFQLNGNQAVCLPKPVALPDTVKEVHVVRMGTARLIVPFGETWDLWFKGEGVTEDFMEVRGQPEDSELFIKL